MISAAGLSGSIGSLKENDHATKAAELVNDPEHLGDAPPREPVEREDVEPTQLAAPGGLPHALELAPRPRTPEAGSAYQSRTSSPRAAAARRLAARGVRSL